MKKAIILLIASASASNFIIAHAAEIGHLNAGVLDMRDYFLPEPGIYGEMYHKLLGATYDGYVAPAFANDSLEAALSIASAVGDSIRNSSFALGDLYMQHVRLDLAEQHWDLSLAYGFYTSPGKFNTRNVTLPDEAPVTMESRDSIGLGYWTRQAQAGFAWYPMTNKATAITAIGTYEYDSQQDDADIKPGQMITLNWGVSQYLPVSENHELLLEVGPAGYDSYQITDSTGSNTLLANAKTCIHAAGGQIGLTYRPWNAFLTLHSFYEYAARSRFQGVSIGLNFGIKF